MCPDKASSSSTASDTFLVCKDRKIHAAATQLTRNRNATLTPLSQCVAGLRHVCHHWHAVAQPMAHTGCAREFWEISQSACQMTSFTAIGRSTACYLKWFD